MPPLEYNKEIDQIIQNAGVCKQGLKYKKCVATLDNFQQCLNEMPIALHFAGHGIKNTAFDTEQADVGDILVFEDEYGKAQYVPCKVLREILRSCPKQPEFVFVSSCHSRLVGDVFKTAGVRHVICVKRSEKILDQVAILFAQEFYKTFFLPHGTACAAFEVARAKVMAKTAEHVDHTPFLAKRNDYMKFELLTESGNSMPHSCLTSYVIPEGLPEEINPPMMYKDIPTRVENFIGRSKDMHGVISLLKNARVVTIKGLAGIGKTSVAKALIHFFMERRVFADGIIYISLCKLESTDHFLSQLHKAAKCTSVNAKDKLAAILSTLKDRQVLLVMSNAEELLSKDKQKFVFTIYMLLSRLPGLKILLISRINLGSLPDLTEKVYDLPPLDARSAIALLEKRSPRLINTNELNELFKEVKSSPNELKVKFEGHKLMLLLGGHPQAISLAATLLQYRTLKEIYQELMQNGLNVEEMSSLKTNISLSIDNLRELNVSSIKFFKMMGWFPSGLSTEEMKNIWGTGYNEHIKNLQYVSLLSRTLQEDRYFLPPLFADYTNSLNDHDQDIADVIQKSYRFYTKKLEEIYVKEGNEVFMRDEDNVVALIVRGSGKEPSLDFDEDSFEVKRLGAYDNQVHDVVTDNNKELVPTREGVEVFEVEEQKEAPVKNINQSTFNARRGSRYNEPFLPNLRRRNSEVLHTLGLIIEEPYDDTLKRKEGIVKEAMTPYGKLIVYYCAVLSILRRYKEVKRIAMDYINAPGIFKDTLAQGNLYKLLGFACDKLSDAYGVSAKYYRLAKQLFFKSNSYLGQAACLIALGEIELKKEKHDKAKWSYENALRHYSIIKHSYGIAWCNSSLFFIKERIELRNNSREYMIQARLRGDIQVNSNVNYIGGTFIKRWEASADNFIIEIARVTNGKIKCLSIEFMADSRMKHEIDTTFTKDLYEDMENHIGFSLGLVKNDKVKKEIKHEIKEEPAKLSLTTLAAIPLKIKNKPRNPQAVK